MKKLLVLLIAMSTLWAAGAGAPADKVDVCHHAAGAGAFHLINISGNAFDKHLDHGDGQPGGVVPGMSDYDFTDSCDMAQTVELSPETIWANGGDYENVYVQNAIDSGYFGTVVMTLAPGGDETHFVFSFSNLNPDELYTVYVDNDGGTANDNWTELGTFVADAEGNGAYHYDVTLASGAYDWSFWVNQSVPGASVLQTDTDLEFTIQ
jgi:hypothetical protein